MVQKSVDGEYVEIMAKPVNINQADETRVEDKLNKLINQLKVKARVKTRIELNQRYVGLVHNVVLVVKDILCDLLKMI